MDAHDEKQPLQPTSEQGTGEQGAQHTAEPWLLAVTRSVPPLAAVAAAFLTIDPQLIELLGGGIRDHG